MTREEPYSAAQAARDREALAFELREGRRLRARLAEVEAENERLRAKTIQVELRDEEQLRVPWWR